ncbi:MAG: 4Fe-4S dicluster domain-containing protein [Candidatus Tectomicrobia bacterium]|uniref:4Fe-4S dicluster domain-containing protein n=1 Tax=Tectimicrobiota bacterium TaxID=2528274 RepID=A0A932CNV1_UNCTE|nr:4Fe-4S dicluster domain-containing protein [Candidatus Tectomicrobia bacterium]
MSHGIPERSQARPAASVSLIPKEQVRFEGDRITVGETSVALSEIAEEFERYRELLREIITDEWYERRLQQVLPRLTPFPQAHHLAEWDRQNLERYRPVFLAAPSGIAGDHGEAAERCPLCPQGPCPLGQGKSGPCGLTLDPYRAWQGWRRAATGTGRLVAQARRLYDSLPERPAAEGREIDLGSQIFYSTPLICLITGLRPGTLRELEPAIAYLEEQMAQSSPPAPKEDSFSGSSPLPGIEAMQIQTFHLGLLAFLAMEICEVLNICGYGHQSAGHYDIVSLQKWPPPTTRVGVAAADRRRYVVLLIGTGEGIAHRLVQEVSDRGLAGEVELCGLGKAGLKLSRLYPETVILGTAGELRKVLRLRLPDLILSDQACCPADWLEEASRARLPVLLVSGSFPPSVPDLTPASPEEILSRWQRQPTAALAVLDPEKAVAVALAARGILPRGGEEGAGLPHQLPEPLPQLASRCQGCGQCEEGCPAELEIAAALRAARKGELGALQALQRNCLFCGSCEKRCPAGLPLIEISLAASEEILRSESSWMRAGRGPITHVEYRDAAFSQWSTSPGFIALTGCCQTPRARQELPWLAEELASLGFALCLSGCAAIAAAQEVDAQGRSLYQRHYGTLQARGVLNLGECTANCHKLGGDLKVMALDGRVPFRANAIELADFLLNRFRVCALLWGAITEEMWATALGWARLGTPVIVGPLGSQSWETCYLGDHAERARWWLWDLFRGVRLHAEPAPGHLIAPVETKEEAVHLAAQLMLGPCDPAPAREVKLAHLIDTYGRLGPGFPPGWERFVRSATELPWRLKFKLLRDLEEKGWEVEVKKGRSHRFRLPDGSLVTEKELAEAHRIPHGSAATRMPQLVLRGKTKYCAGIEEE